MKYTIHSSCIVDYDNSSLAGWLAGWLAPGWLAPGWLREPWGGRARAGQRERARARAGSERERERAGPRGQRATGVGQRATGPECCIFGKKPVLRMRGGPWALGSYHKSVSATL